MINSKNTVHIQRPVHEVFEYLKDHENRIHWQGNLVTQEHQQIEKGTKVTEVRNVLGKRVEIEGEITEFEADKKLTFVGKGPHVKRLEYHYQLAAEDGGTRLDSEVDFELSDLMGMARPIIQKLTDRELEHAQRTLKDILEMPEAHAVADKLPAHEHHRRAGAGH